MDLYEPTYIALVKRYEAENRRPATEEEKKKLRRMATELLQDAFTDEPDKEDFVTDDEFVDYRYQAHQVLGFIFCYHNNFSGLNSFYDLDKAIKELDEKLSFDVLVPVLAGYENVEASIRYKKKRPGIVLVVYQMDPCKS